MNLNEYRINHARRGCYEVILVTGSADDLKHRYLTNFRNKKAALKFIEAHEKGEVKVDPETCIPTPDFK